MPLDRLGAERAVRVHQGAHRRAHAVDRLRARRRRRASTSRTTQPRRFRADLGVPAATTCASARGPSPAPTTGSRASCAATSRDRVIRAVLIDRNPRDAHARTRSSRWPTALDARRLADRVSRRHAQHDRRDAAAVQERHLPPRRARARTSSSCRCGSRTCSRVMPKGKLLPRAAALHADRSARRSSSPRARSKTRSSPHARRAARAAPPRSDDAPHDAHAADARLFVGIGAGAGRRVDRRLRRSSAAVAKGAPHATIDNLNARIKAWWVMVLVIGLAFLFGKRRRDPAVRCSSRSPRCASSSRSRTRAAPTTARSPPRFFVVLPLQYLLVYIDWYGLYSIFIPVYAFLLLPILEVARAATPSASSSARRRCSGG